MEIRTFFGPVKLPNLRSTHLLRELLSLRLHVLDRARHVEGRLGQGVVRAREDLLEGADGVLEGHELALVASEDLRDLEGLRHETLDLTGTLDLVKRMISTPV